MDEKTPCCGTSIARIKVAQRQPNATPPPGYIRLFGPTGEKGERGCGWILHEGWAERNAQLEGESPQHSTISLPKEGIQLHSIYSGPGEPTTEWETQATKVAKGGGHIWLGDTNADPNKPQTTKWGQWQDSFQKSGMEPLNHKGKWAKMNTRFPGENEKNPIQHRHHCNATKASN